MEKLNLDKSNLRKFGITMGAAFLLISIVVLLRHKSSTIFILSISGLFFCLAIIAPILLRPIYIIWMKLAFILSWINTRLILILIFYLVLTPVSFCMRIFRVVLLDKKIDKNKESYWQDVDAKAFVSLNYRRQF